MSVPKDFGWDTVTNQKGRNNSANAEAVSPCPDDQKRCRKSLVGRYIEHMPFIQDKTLRLAVWSDVKEVLFPSCSNPDCDIVLNALKVVSRYPWEGKSMQPCSPVQQVIFLRSFRLVPSGTLLVDVDFVKDNIEDLWEMVWLKHSTSRDLNSRNCHYVVVQRKQKMCTTLHQDDQAIDDDETQKEDISKNATRIVQNAMSDFKIMEKNSTETGNNINNTETCRKNVLNTSFNKEPSVNNTELHCPREKLKVEHIFPSIETVKLLLKPNTVDVLPEQLFFPQRRRRRHGTFVLPLMQSCETRGKVQLYASASEISAMFSDLHDYLMEGCGRFVAGHTNVESQEIRRCTNTEGRCFTSWKIRRHGWNKPWQHVTSRDLIVSWETIIKQLSNMSPNAVTKMDEFLIDDSNLISIKENFDNILSSDENDKKSHTKTEKQTSDDSVDAGKEDEVKVSINRNSTVAGKVQSISPEPLPPTLKQPIQLSTLCQLNLGKYAPNNNDTEKPIPKCHLEFKSQQRDIQRKEVITPPTGSAICPETAKEVEKYNKKHNLTEAVLKQKQASDISINGNENAVEITNNSNHVSEKQCQSGVFSTDTKSVSVKDKESNTPRNERIVCETDKSMKHPKKRQRLTSPPIPDNVTAKHAANDNGIDTNVPDITQEEINHVRPTVSDLLRHHVARKRIPVFQQIADMQDISTNQNALNSNDADNSQKPNKYLTSLSSAGKNRLQSLNKFQSSTSSKTLKPLQSPITTLRPVRENNNRMCPRGTSSLSDTFRNLNKHFSFQKQHLQRIAEVSQKKTTSQKEMSDSDLPQTSSSEPVKCQKTLSPQKNATPSKSYPQWDIDQILKGHPSGCKGDTLYGISISKTKKLQENSKSGKEPQDVQKDQQHTKSDSKQDLNDVLPKFVKRSKLNVPNPPTSRIRQVETTHEKSLWYRNESISNQPRRISEKHFLDLVSGNPFTQTVESLKALRQFRSEFNCRQGNPNRNTALRFSPLPKIDTQKKHIVPRKTEKVEVHKEQSSSSTENTRKVITIPLDSADISETVRKIASSDVCDEKEQARKVTDYTEVRKEERNHSRKTKKTTREQTNSKFCNINSSARIHVKTSSEEPPRLSRSENYIQFQECKNEDKKVCKSVSSPVLPTDKYKVTLNDMTMTFTRIKDAKKKTGKKVKIMSNSENSKEEKKENEKLNIDGKDVRNDSNESKQTVPLEAFENVGPVEIEKDHSSPPQTCHGHVEDNVHFENKGKYSNSEDLGCMTLRKELKTEEKSNSNRKMDKKPNFAHIHNKKRWIWQYKKNVEDYRVADTLINKKIRPHATAQEESTDIEFIKDVSELQTVIYLNEDDLVEGDRITLITQSGETANEHQFEHPVNDQILMSENTFIKPNGYSETDTIVSDHCNSIIQEHDTDIGLVEEIVDNTIVLSNSDAVLTNQVQQSKKKKNAKSACRKNDLSFGFQQDGTDVSFKGSVYVLNNNEKPGCSGQTDNDSQILRRSVRQHLSPRKNITDDSDKDKSEVEMTKKGMMKKNKRRSKKKNKACLNSTSDSACKSTKLQCPEQIENVNIVSGTKGKGTTCDFKHRSASENRKTDIGQPSCASCPVNFEGKMEAEKAIYVTSHIEFDEDNKTTKSASKSLPVGNTDKLGVNNPIATDLATNKSKDKARNPLRRKTTEAKSVEQTVVSEQKRILEIIKQGPSSTAKGFTSKNNGPIKCSTECHSFSFIPIYNTDGGTNGGYAHLEGVTCPYILMNGYKFVAVQDVVKIFTGCNKRCKIARGVLTKYKGLFRTFCDWDQVYTLDQLFHVRGRTVKTGDMLVRIDSLSKNMPFIKNQIKEEHLMLKNGKSAVTCLCQWD